MDCYRDTRAVVAAARALGCLERNVMVGPYLPSCLLYPDPWHMGSAANARYGKGMAPSHAALQASASASASGDLLGAFPRHAMNAHTGMKFNIEPVQPLLLMQDL